MCATLEKLIGLNARNVKKIGRLSLGKDARPAPLASSALQKKASLMRCVFSLFSALIVGAMAVVLAVSFASIVYTGPLAMYLDRGIGTTLLAAAIASAIGAALFSFRGTNSMAQDLTAILLSGAAASIAVQIGDGGGVFATVFMLLAVAAALTGLIMMLLGALRLSFVIRFIPYPVMGGFLVATGYLLLLGGIGILTGESMTLWTLPSLFAVDALHKWLPWIMIAAGFVVAQRLISNSYTLPACIAVACGGFYAYLWLSGMSLADATDRGFLLGPFGSGGFLDDLRPSMVADVEWRLIAEQGATLLAVAAMSVLGSALNLSGIELSTKRPVNTDRDFIVIGASNFFASPTGGLIAFPGFSLSVLGHRLGLPLSLGSAVAALCCLGVALFGAGLVEVLPRGLFAAIIAYLGIDLLYSWLFVERKRLMAGDFATVLLILAVSAAFGFLIAFGLGLLISALLFVVSYARLDFLRLESDLSLRRSTIERDLGEMDHLSVTGKSVRVLEFSGYLFFGTAARIKARIESEVASPETRPASIILDFTHVQGIDASAIHNIHLIGETCGSHGVAVVMCGLSHQDSAKMERFIGRQLQGVTLFDSLDDALADAEEGLLSARKRSGVLRDDGSFLDILRAAHPGVALETLFPAVNVAAGEALFHAGADSEEMYVLVSGDVRVQITTDAGNTRIIAKLRPGALIGEVAFYGGIVRSADLVAAQPSQLLTISRSALHDIEQTDPAFVLGLSNLAAEYLARRMSRTTRLLGSVLP